MNEYFCVEALISTTLEDEIDTIAHKDYACTGIEEFAIEEARVDEILGERSYSGGDVPESIIHEVESTVKGSGITKKYYFETKLESEKFFELLKNSYKLKSTLTNVEITDWNEEWKKNYSPIEISKNLEVIPEWFKDSYETNAQTKVYIYPGQGFGTGSHETTFLCLKLMDEYFTKNTKDINIKSCLDFGCGSGILGIALEKILDTNDVDLYDIDPAALENTKQNITLNDIDEKNFKLLLPNQKSLIERKYDFVFANILQNVLLLEADYLVNCLNLKGQLILSGLLDGQEQDVIKKYQQLNPKLKLIKVIKKADWVAVLMEQS